MGLLLAPPAPDREAAIQRAVDTYRVIGSPGFEFDEQAAELILERSLAFLDRVGEAPPSLANVRA